MLGQFLTDQFHVEAENQLASATNAEVQIVSNSVIFIDFIHGNICLEPCIIHIRLNTEA